jgi:hypothetical protein
MCAHVNGINGSPSPSIVLVGIAFLTVAQVLFYIFYWLLIFLPLIHPSIVAKEPILVVSSQYSSDEETLSISKHVGLHIIFHLFLGVVTSFLFCWCKVPWTGRLFSSNHNAKIPLAMALGYYCSLGQV